MTNTRQDITVHHGELTMPAWRSTAWILRLEPSSNILEEINFSTPCHKISMCGLNCHNPRIKPKISFGMLERRKKNLYHYWLTNIKTKTTVIVFDECLTRTIPSLHLMPTTVLHNQRLIFLRTSVPCNSINLIHSDAKLLEQDRLYLQCYIDVSLLVVSLWTADVSSKIIGVYDYCGSLPLSWTNLTLIWAHSALGLTRYHQYWITRNGERLSSTSTPINLKSRS